MKWKECTQCLHSCCFHCCCCCFPCCCCCCCSCCCTCRGVRHVFQEVGCIWERCATRVFDVCNRPISRHKQNLAPSNGLMHRTANNLEVHDVDRVRQGWVHV